MVVGELSADDAGRRGLGPAAAVTADGGVSALAFRADGVRRNCVSRRACCRQEDVGNEAGRRRRRGERDTSAMRVTFAGLLRASGALRSQRGGSAQRSAGGGRRKGTRASRCPHPLSHGTATGTAGHSIVSRAAANWIHQRHHHRDGIGCRQFKLRLSGSYEPLPIRSLSAIPDERCDMSWRAPRL